MKSKFIKKVLSAVMAAALLFTTTVAQYPLAVYAEGEENGEVQLVDETGTNPTETPEENPSVDPAVENTNTGDDGSDEDKKDEPKLICSVCGGEHKSGDCKLTNDKIYISN